MSVYADRTAGNPGYGAVGRGHQDSGSGSLRWSSILLEEVGLADLVQWRSTRSQVIRVIAIKIWPTSIG
jgi:hypothetical protein